MPLRVRTSCASHWFVDTDEQGAVVAASLSMRRATPGIVKLCHQCHVPHLLPLFELIEPKDSLVIDL